MDVAAALAAMHSTLADADVELVTVLGGHREITQARLWHGTVLVDWEPDDQAGGALLRPELMQRLIALHAEIMTSSKLELRLRASGRVVAALSDAHRELVTQLGGPSRVELRTRLRFSSGVYQGGDERYAVLDAGRRLEVLALTVQVSPRTSQAAPPRTSPART
jgi:hypothetical protein